MGRDSGRVERLGRDNMGKMQDLGDRGKTTLPCMYLCNNPACSAHVPQNLKYNKIYILKKRKKKKKWIKKTDTEFNVTF